MPTSRSVATGPHLMIIVADPALREGIPANLPGGPYVMWRGTPFVHVMIPVEPNSAHMHQAPRR
jgi:hypothetical protein